jgi:hypothetical protein
MDAPSPSLPPSRPIGQLILGMFVGNAVGGALLGGTIWAMTFFGVNQRDAGGVLALPSFILIPFIVGLVAAWFWRRLNRSVAISFLDALWTLLVSLAAAAIILREGVVCLVIVSPLVYVFLFTGILIGRVWFRPNYSKLQLTIFPLLVLLTLGETVYHSEQRDAVTDRILIHASPAKVWPHVLAFPEIPGAPGYWLFRLGLPYPTQTTNGGNFIGADRQCIFSNGVVIKERVAEFVPNEKLTFDVAEQPTDPEAYGHITLHRGQFVLQDNHDGTTTLIGSSWYTLHVRPRWYFDLWTRDMTGAVHLRVMNHIKRLAENPE